MNPMKIFKILLSLFLVTFFISSPLIGDEFEFNKIEMSFKNFLHCELTRTDATQHFKGKPFKITMIDLFDIQNEADLKIITGAVECFVVDKYITLYVAIGLKSLVGKEQVMYYTTRDKDFTILATELIKFPYKERCNWSQYLVNIY